MNINLTSDKLIKDIQLEFNQVFPFLRIEFIRKPHPFMQSSEKVYALPHELIMANAAKSKTSINVDISSSMTVREVEEICEKDFGVLVEFYRKSGINWLEITMTDDWTIQQQNNLGNELSKLFVNVIKKETVLKPD
ncbi:MAG: hypothetical protein WKF89_03700 [Chitinophagaceae bacterium]